MDNSDSNFYDACIAKGIPEETAKWLSGKEIYAKIVKEPFTFLIGLNRRDGETKADIFSDKYLKEATPEKIRQGFWEREVRSDSPKASPEEIDQYFDESDC